MFNTLSLLTTRLFQYETADEHNMRFWTFYKNSKLWNRENRRQKEQGGAVYGATQFADLSTEEFAKFYLNKVWNLSL